MQDNATFSLQIEQGRKAYHDAHLGPFRTILNHFDQFGTNWDLLGLFGTIWYHLGPLGIIWDN